MTDNEKLAAKVKQCVSDLGDAIEEAVEAGMLVSLEVFYNEGSESMTLPALNGEFRIVVGLFQEL